MCVFQEEHEMKKTADQLILEYEAMKMDDMMDGIQG